MNKKYIIPILLSYSVINFCMDSDTLIARLAAPLCAAAEKNDIKEARELIAAGANPNVIPNYQSYSPLQCAAFNDSVEVARYLISIGANIDAVYSTNGVSALGCAAVNNSLQVAFLLIENGADLDAGFPNDKPILIASRNGHTEMIQLLINAKNTFNKPIPYINTADNGSYTSLYYAALGGHFNAVQELVKAGASIKIKGFNGENPIDAARSAGHHSIADYLEKIQKAQDEYLRQSPGKTTTITVIHSNFDA